jgi:hypothetical protein
MRQFASGLNRTWLALIGVVMLVAGLVGTAISTGLLSRLIGGSAASPAGPRPDDPTMGSSVSDFFTNPTAVAGVTFLGVVLAVLGLAWLLAQIPRTNAASPLRLHDDASHGLTTIGPAVLTDAVSEDLRTLPGVTDSDAVLRGTANEPELTLRLTANDRTDIKALLTSVQDVAVANLETAMGQPLTRLAVQVDVSPQRRTADRVTLARDHREA